MNPLSKALVLLVAVLTVALSAFSIAYVGAASNYQKALVDAKSQASILETKLAAASAQLESKASGWDTARDELTAANRTMKEQLGVMSADLQTLRRSQQNAQADLAAANAALQTSVATLKNAQSEAGRTSAKLVEIMDAKQKVEGEKAECLARIAALDHENRQLSNSIAELKEQSMTNARVAQEARLELGQLKAMVGKAAAGPAPVAAAHDIEGAVSAVRTTTNGVRLVSLNVGAQDHVVEGMRFTLSRGGNYLGTMVVDSVDGNSSFGRITDEKGAPGAGDTAYIRGLAR